MLHYVTAKDGSDEIAQVVHYSSPPPAPVLATWAKHGFRLVKVPSPRAAQMAREIARAPQEWTALDREVVRR